MLLSITTTHQPATDLGYLLGKHPERLQTFELAYGNAHVFYPEAGADRCTACLLLDIDPIGLVRNHRGNAAVGLGQLFCRSGARMIARRTTYDTGRTR